MKFNKETFVTSNIERLKFCLTISVLFLCASCNSYDSNAKFVQGINAISKTIRNTYVNDTFFLQRTDFSNSRYYEHFHKTEEYGLCNELVPRIRDKNFSITNSFYSNEKSTIEITKVDLKGMPTLWTELIYFDEYYINYPSDFCGLSQKIVTDSCLIVTTCEGPLPVAIKKVSRPQANQFSLELQDGRNLLVTIIDSTRGIALWEDSANKTELMVDVNKFRKLPIVKADCNGNKCRSEIQSLKMNVAKLKKNARDI